LDHARPASQIWRGYRNLKSPESGASTRIATELISPGMTKTNIAVCIAILFGNISIAAESGLPAPKPLFRDPVHDGAADPVVIWNPQPLKLASEKVIDACVVQLTNNLWRMWYNNERDKKSIYYADSTDLVK
jgi:hypothetical protein